MSGPVDAYFSQNAYLPVQPKVRRNLLAIVESSASQEVRRAAIEEAVYAYPLFSYNLLKLINSPTYNLKTKVSSLKQAATLPTFDKLTELIGAMPEYPAALSDIFSLTRFEEHSRATAMTVQILATISRKFSSLDRERLVTAGVFHDIGRVFLLLSDPDGTRRLLKESDGDPAAVGDVGTWGAGGADPAAVGDVGTWGRGAADPAVSVIENERKYFGTDHAALGVLALEAIGISDKDILASVGRHHDVPSGAAVLVAFADRVVKRFGIGPSAGAPLSVTPEGQDDVRLRVALEEAVHMTVGEVLMHILSDIDGLLASSTGQIKSLAGAVD